MDTKRILKKKKREREFSTTHKQPKRFKLGDTHSDHDNWLDQQLRASQMEASKRWGFDFDNEVPLKGRYTWIPVNMEDIPQLYHQKN